VATSPLAAVAVVIVCYVVAAALMAVAPGVLTVVAALVAERAPVVASVASEYFVLALSVVAVVGAGVPAASVEPGVLGAVVASLVDCVVALVAAALVS